MKKCKIVNIFCLIILLVHTNLLAQTANNMEVFGQLIQKDIGLKSNTYNKAISFTLKRSASFIDPLRQGTQIEDCVLTRKGGVTAMKITYDYEKEMPVYVPPEVKIWDPSLDYDKQGRLIVWRKVEKNIYSSPTMNKNIRVIRPYYVHPDGKTVDVGDNYTKVSIYPVGHQENVCDISLFHMIMGRGFSNLTGYMYSLGVLPTGMITAKAQALAYSGAHFDLIIDPNDYLVRKAKYMFDGQVDPSAEVNNTGKVTRDGLTYAKTGILKLRGLPEISIVINDEQPKVDDVYNYVLDHMNRPLEPQKTTVTDYRGEETVVRKPTDKEINPSSQ